MKPSKAIEILEDIRVNGTEPGYPIDDAALRLGIEALRAWRLYRPNPVNKLYQLLPGETKE